MASLFQQLEIEAFRKGITPRTKESIRWFQKKASQMGKVSRTGVMQDDSIELRNRPITKPYGNMYMYFYDAKHKDTLPYYDAFPLTIVVGPAKDGFYGINLHYLPPKVRAIFLDKLNDTASNQKFNATTRFKLTYKLLMATRSYKYFKPCFKHYLSANVTSNIMKVNAAEWNIAIFLQTANFKKASVGTVWSDSARKY